MLSVGTVARAEVWIQTTKGDRLEEYEVTSLPARDGEPPFSRCFAECKEGTEFEVHVRMLSTHSKHDCWFLKCYVDGKKLDPKAVTEKTFPTERVFRHFHEMSDGRLVAKALTFGRVPTVEDKNDALSSGDVLLGLGTIEVTLERGSTRETKSALPAATINSEILAWEQDAKAKIASYALGGTISEIRPKSRVHFTSKGPIYYRFQLNYRTKEKLQIMKIIDKDDPENEDPNVRGSTSTLPPRSSEKRKRTSHTDEAIYVSDDDGSTAGYRLKKRNKYLEDEVTRLRRQLKAKVMEPESAIEIPDSDGE